MKLLLPILIFVCVFLNVDKSYGQAPVANFTASDDTGCAPAIIQFNNTSTGATSYSWNFGDGSGLSGNTNPGHTYGSPGSYTVTLTATNTSGSSVKTMVITILGAPIVSFSASPVAGCPPLPVNFTNSSNPVVPGVATYSWSFGDGSAINTTQNPPHTYQNPGFYNVTLSVTNSAGCVSSQTLTQYINVYDPPDADFTFTPVCKAPGTTTFTSTVTTGTPPYTYHWDYGDNTTPGTTANPTHTYATSGTFNVTLVVTDVNGCMDIVVKPLGVGTLNANFTAPPLACLGMPVIFINTSVNAGNYLWYFGDNTTSSSSNPVHTYTTPGTYNVMLVAWDMPNVCTDTFIVPITVSPGPTASFNISPQYTCGAPATINFTSTSTGGAVSYVWNFGDGSPTVTGATATHTYTTDGAFTVTLVATDANGCKDTAAITKVIEKVQVAVEVDRNYNHCLPSTVNFSYLINYPPGVASVTWDFGDGSPPVSGVSFPSHTYTVQGVHVVTLTITTNNGCTATDTAQVTMGTKPNAFFAPVFDTLCSQDYTPIPFSFVNTSTNATDYYWHYWSPPLTNDWLPDGYSIPTSPNGSYFPPTSPIPPLFYAALVASNYGCQDTFFHPDPLVILKPVAQALAYPDCDTPTLVRFFDMSEGHVNSRLWIFGDGTTDTSKNPVHMYPSLGNWPVTLEATNDTTGCTSRDLMSLFLHVPTAEFSVSDTAICKGDTLLASQFTQTFSHPVSLYGYTFNPPNVIYDGNVGGFIFPFPGLYTVTLSFLDFNGCTHDTSKTNYILVADPNPSFSVTPTIGCAPLVTNFTETGTNTPGAYTTNWTWVFGDGTTANLTSGTTTHTYAPGIYSVKVYLTDNVGCVDSLLRPNYIQSRQTIAAFKADDTTACLNQPIDFTNNSSSSTGAVLTYTWDFGDGSPTSNAVDPIHTYTQTGAFTVTLIATDNTGCADTLTLPAYIKVAKPSASFTMSDTFALCPPLIVQFTNSSTGAAGYTWDFGDGSSPSPVPNPSNIYTNPGIYNIRLIATNSYGCTDTAFGRANVLGYSGAYTTNWTWVFGDGTTANLTSGTTTHTYAPGIYSVKVYLTDNVGCVDSLLRPNYIQSRQTIAAFKADDTTACLNQPIDFTNNSSSSTGAVLTYTWDFGDGSPTSNAVDPIHTYTQTGAFTVTLIATDNTGCADTLTLPAYIKVAKPSASFTMSDTFALCPPLIVQFTNSSTGAAGYTWDFGDGSSPSPVPNPSNIYTNPGIYNIRLIATNSYGCTDTAFGRANVLGYSGALDYMPQAGCNPLTVNFTANLTNVSNFLWDFSDGTIVTATGNTITHTYTLPGRYLPRIVFTDSAGCVNSSDGLDTIKVDDIIGNFNFSPACVNTLVTLKDTSYSYFSAVNEWKWDINNGQVRSNVKAPTATFTLPGTYPIVLIVKNANGCKDTVYENLTIHPLPTITANGDTIICLGDAATLSALGGNSYEWTPAASVGCATCQITSASPTEATNYIVMGTDANGCKNTDTTHVAVKTQTNSTAGSGGEICVDSSIQLHVSGAQRYEWTPASTLDDPTSADPIATPDVTTVYTVLAYEGSCLPDSHSVRVVVHPLPTVNAGSDETIVAGNSVNLNASGTDISTYAWSPDQTLSCNTCSSPIASPYGTTTYTVTVATDFGCKAKDDVTIFVLCDEGQLFIPNTFSPNGDGDNDVFYPRGIGLRSIRSFRVYNRWGELVYERQGIQLNDAVTAWDGTYKGNKLSPDVFVYVLEGVCEGGEIMTWKGDISLVR